MAKNKYAKLVGSIKNPPVQEQAFPSQVLNNTGGYVFNISEMKQLDRFLILGSESPTYYASAEKMTKENAKNLTNLLKSEKGVDAVKRIVEVSKKGLAPKNQTSVFALALAAAEGNSEAKTLAYKSLGEVCRTGTDLFAFMEISKSLRSGYGMGFRKAINNWYLSKECNQLSYQVSKYQNRNGWTHKDVISLCHPKTNDELKNDIFKWCLGKEVAVSEQTLPCLYGFEMAKKASSSKEIVKLIESYNLVREHIPTNYLNTPEVWEALLKDMPLTAMVRNLGNMSKAGILNSLSSGEKKVLSALSDKDYIKKSRLHPLAILVALKTYSLGHGVKGSNSWTVNPRISDALDEAFYLAFDNIEPCNKNIYLAVDCSSSMTYSEIGGMTGITPNIAAATMSMVTAKAEKNWLIKGFASSLVDLRITPKMKLDAACKATQLSSFGSTNCSLPVQDAIDNKLEVDCFCVYTDNETNTGQHPALVLEKYRQKMGKDVKMVVVGMTATKFSIAKDNDPNSLDVVGFSTDTPDVISGFVSGRF